MSVENFVSIFRVMERALSDSALEIHLSSNSSTAVSTIRGLMVVGLFAWLDTQRGLTNRDYAVLLDPNHPQREPFPWISWEIFRGLKLIRNTFAHSLDGEIDDEDLLTFQELHRKIEANEIKIEYRHEEILREDDVDEFFSIVEIPNSNPQKFRIAPKVSIIHITARIMHQYFEKS